MGVIQPDRPAAGDMNGAPSNIPNNIVIDYSIKLAVDKSFTVGNSAFGGEARLTLKNNALVMETAAVAMAGDDVHTITKQVWSIPFSGSAKEMEFQSDGNLVVRDSGNKVLWASNVSAPRGKRLKMDFTGKLQIFSEHWDILWEK
ncbi:MAG: hypothetical protein H7319_13285 [Spirosoma sp.]|nr:hypothetical protein [Spirosoma sp.]